MRITIEMHGPLQCFNRDGECRAEWELPDDLTVGEVLTHLGMDLNEPWNAGLNGALAAADDKVSDGSLLIVFPPIEGG